MQYTAESFYRAKTRQSLSSTSLPPFNQKVSKVPLNTSGFVTLDPNTSNEELCFYNGIDSTNLTITITIRGIKHNATTLTTDGAGAATGDYNNSDYMKPHTQNAVIRGDINQLHINQMDAYFNLSENETVSWDTTFNWAVSTTKSFKVPVYADATARDAAIPSPANWMIIYNTALGILQQYISGAWASFASGTTVNADTSTAGKVEMATTSEFLQWTSTWGTWASLVVTPSQIMQLVSFGDGSDGDVTISTPTTLTRDMFYNDLVLNDNITTWGYAVYVRWTCSGTWKIIYNWNNWGNASGWTWWTAAAALAAWTCGTNLWWAAWASGSTWAWTNGTAGTAVNPSYATTATTSAWGWAGGWNPANGGTWGATAQATRWDYYNLRFNLSQLLAELYFPARAIRVTTPYGWLPSAGSWASGAGNGGGTVGWGWGAAGWNWWIMFLAIRWISGTWTIESKWWNGWNGAQSPNVNCWGGGGWGGWSGWIVVLVTNGTPPTITLTGWTGWTWGAANWWTSVAWSNGTAGTVGQSIVITV